MSDVKSKFTLHTEYKDFVPGKNQGQIALKMFSPYRPYAIGDAFRGTVLFLLLGLCMVLTTLAAVYQIYIDSQYIHEGQAVTAVVESCKPDPNSNGKIDVSYTYTVDVMYRGSAWLSVSCDDYSLGKVVDVLYLSSHPSTSYLNRPDIASKFYGDILALTFFSISTVICFFFIRSFVRTIKSARYMQHHPEFLPPNIILLEGEVTETRCGTRCDTWYVRVWYRFETPKKRIIEGDSLADRPDLEGKELPPFGAPVTVLYDTNTGLHMML